ncbi:hypothetical protein PHYPO_G00078210 [Pangasianodon hypophthalmus]|uniref:Dual specificity protein phosphatase n=1 Tax=Pangasianodon hypophthalmus TaxID=310915 RepID=A0A5N5LL45_PANHP|nr:hypothetical protein PHYPO_G00078210 [Pangasianodon hypophthalmus]
MHVNVHERIFRIGKDERTRRYFRRVFGNGSGWKNPTNNQRRWRLCLDSPDREAIQACNHADEVWPRLYIGDQDIASNRQELIKLGITHILNCAQSKWRGGAEYYEGMNITYHGIEAHDSPSFDMSVNFYPAAEFIHKALSMGGTVLVHCAVGVSRSATLVLAYLMIRQNMTLVEAIKTVKDHRGVTPNRGFLRQLSGLDSILRASRKTT